MPPPRRLTLALGLLALGMALLLFLLPWQPSVVGRPRGPRVMLTVEPDPSLTEAESKGLDLLMRDHFELNGLGTVLPWVPDGDRRLPGMEKADVIQLRLHPHRAGTRLAWDLESATRRAGPWHPIALPGADPLQAIGNLAVALPDLRLQAPDAALAPAGDAFWPLVEAMGLARMRVEKARALALGRQVQAQSPGCASAQVTLALLTLRAGVDDPGRQAEVLTLLGEALRLKPGHPRISYVTASVLVEMGRHREALDLLCTAVQAHPHLPDPLQGVVYAARTSGLLDLAGRAHRAQERLLLGPPPRLPLLVLLYRREFAAFERHCREGEAQSPTLANYYLGCLDLARGRPQEARQHLNRAWHPVDPGWEDIGTLASVWSLHLDGQRDEARRILTDLEHRRAADRAPDGEFTFMMAETRGLLGDVEAAMDLAHRAFAQGFACTDWYVHSPYLYQLRLTPRWRDLEAHLIARQHLLESRFPPAAFGL